MKISALLLAFVSIASVSVEGALPIPQDQLGATLRPSHRAQAVISGLEADQAHFELPPVLVELSNLPLQASVWVQVRRIGAETAALPVTVKSVFYRRQGTDGILSVPGLQRACRGEGTWKVEVLLSEGPCTAVLASETFRVADSPAMVSDLSGLHP